MEFNQSNVFLIEDIFPKFTDRTIPLLKGRPKIPVVDQRQDHDYVGSS